MQLEPSPLPSRKKAQAADKDGELTTLQAKVEGGHYADLQVGERRGGTTDTSIEDGEKGSVVQRAGSPSSSSGGSCFFFLFFFLLRT